MEKQIEELKAAVEAVEGIAAKLAQDKYHGQSAAITAARARLTGAKEMLEAHQLWMVANPAQQVQSPKSKVQS